MKSFHHFLHIIFILLLVFLASSFSPINAISSFIKSPSNPVLTPNSTTWEGARVWQPSVVHDGNEFKMWYASYNGRFQIGLASSSDGLSWTKNSNNPVISRISLDNRDSHDPTILFNGSTYEMWYASSIGGGSTDFAIQRATSNDGIIWTNNPIARVFQPSSGWGAGTATAPFVIKNGSQYKMWYTSNDGRWKIGYATSPDGINWTQYSGNPVLYPTESWEGTDVADPTVIFDGTTYEIFYNNASGIAHAISFDGINWTNKTSLLSPSGGAFDSGGMYASSAIRLTNGTTLLYYGGRDAGNTWRIGLATNGSISFSTPTPTPLPPVVIIPGMMASWNKEAILEGQVNPGTPWKMLPFVTEYTGIMDTLKGLGYTENQNLFLWPYDWRKSVATIQSSLDTFITNTVKPANPSQTINLIGHSLGGLVARAWTQTGTNQSDVKHLITAGTPNQGAAIAYPAWSAGDLPQDNSLLWLGERLVLQLNRRSFATNRETIRSSLPVIQNLLPLAAYLRRQSDNQLIDPATMSFTNTWLSDLNTSASATFPLLDALTGTTFSTINGYVVSDPSWIDTALGNWTDGKPVTAETTTEGDNLVTLFRAKLTGDTGTSVSQNHKNTIAASDSIDAILDILAIAHTDADIVAGSPTSVTPGLLFLVRSPVSLQVTHNGTTHDGPDGIVFIPSPDTGTYDVKLTGTGAGPYTLIAAQFTDSANTWKEYTGTITPGAQKIYSISVTANTLLTEASVATTTTQKFDEINQLILNLTNHNSLTAARRSLALARSAIAIGRHAIAKTNLEQSITQLSIYRKTQNTENTIQASLQISEKIAYLYKYALGAQTSLFPLSETNRFSASTASYDSNLTRILTAATGRGESIGIRARRFQSAQEYRSQAEAARSGGSLAEAKIFFYLSQLLFREAL
ncbi:hypothetical protein HY948_04170 [Candidatus Gottesmanbacteria bacterium]|nr:hypothetical protein [Candidatus Gottesmanbacteria bacterium]